MGNFVDCGAELCDVLYTVVVSYWTYSMHSLVFYYFSAYNPCQALCLWQTLLHCRYSAGDFYVHYSHYITIAGRFRYDVWHSCTHIWWFCCQKLTAFMDFFFKCRRHICVLSILILMTTNVQKQIYCIENGWDQNVSVQHFCFENTNTVYWTK